MSYRTVRSPTEEEREELKRMKRQEVGRVGIRAHIVLLSDRNRSVPEIAEIHDVSTPMVYKWIDRFDEEGPSGQTDTSVTIGSERAAHQRSTKRLKLKLSVFCKSAQLTKEKTGRGGRPAGLRNTSKESLT